MRGSLFLTAALVAVFPFAVHAQSGTATGTGSDLETGSGTVRTSLEILQDISTRSSLVPVKTRTQLNVSPAKLSAWQTEEKRLRDRLAEHRAECREALRRANRDTLMKKTLQCYRSDLLQEMHLMREYNQYLAGVPALTAEMRADTDGTLMELLDALTAIIDAIDTGLFERVESLEEAKRNLREQYRVPYWSSIIRLRAHRELTFLVFIAKQLEGRAADSSIDGAHHVFLENSVHCLDAASASLRAVPLSADWLAASAQLKTAQGTLQECQEKLKALARHERQRQAQKEENATNPKPAN